MGKQTMLKHFFCSYTDAITMKQSRVVVDAPLFGPFSLPSPLLCIFIHIDILTLRFGHDRRREARPWSDANTDLCELSALLGVVSDDSYFPSFLRSFLRSFVLSFFRSFIPSFLRSFFFFHLLLFVLIFLLPLSPFYSLTYFLPLVRSPPVLLSLTFSKCFIFGLPRLV